MFYYAYFHYLCSVGIYYSGLIVYVKYIHSTGLSFLKDNNPLVKLHTRMVDNPNSYRYAPASHESIPSGE